jgi:hypothetical protein
LLTVQVYSRYGFEEVTAFTDQNVDEFPNEYFICIHATGWIHAIPYFKQPHKNVLNLVFDDVEKDRKKWIHEYVPIPYSAIACNLLIIYQITAQFMCTAQKDNLGRQLWHHLLKNIKIKMHTVNFMIINIISTYTIY